jgi:hypothetical protein
MSDVLPLVVFESLRLQPPAEKLISLDVTHRPKRYVEASMRCSQPLTHRRFFVPYAAFPEGHCLSRSISHRPAGPGGRALM